MSEPDVTRAWPRAHAEERVALALDAGRLGTWYWEVATGRLDWDEPLERVFGVEPGTFPGTLEAYIDLLHPDDRAATLAAIEQSLAARASHSWARTASRSRWSAWARTSPPASWPRGG